MRPRWLEDVEALDDEDVWPIHDDLRVRDDVVAQVRVERGPRLRGAALDLRDEAQQRPLVVGLREALALHESAAFEFRVRVQEAVGRDELDPGGVLPAAEELTQQSGHGRLADGNRAGHADDKRGGCAALAEESARGAVQ